MVLKENESLSHMQNCYFSHISCHMQFSTESCQIPLNLNFWFRLHSHTYRSRVLSLYHKWFDNHSTATMSLYVSNENELNIMFTMPQNPFTVLYEIICIGQHSYCDYNLYQSKYITKFFVHLTVHLPLTSSVSSENMSSKSISSMTDFSTTKMPFSFRMAMLYSMWWTISHQPLVRYAFRCWIKCQPKNTSSSQQIHTSEIQ